MRGQNTRRRRPCKSPNRRKVEPARVVGVTPGAISRTPRTNFATSASRPPRLASRDPRSLFQPRASTPYAAHHRPAAPVFPSQHLRQRPRKKSRRKPCPSRLGVGEHGICCHVHLGQWPGHPGHPGAPPTPSLTSHEASTAMGAGTAPPGPASSASKNVGRPRPRSSLHSLGRPASARARPGGGALRGPPLPLAPVLPPASRARARRSRR